jgi:hypothetical protein
LDDCTFTFVEKKNSFFRGNILSLTDDDVHDDFIEESGNRLNGPHADRAAVLPRQILAELKYQKTSSKQILREKNAQTLS